MMSSDLKNWDTWGKFRKIWGLLHRLIDSSVPDRVPPRLRPSIYAPRRLRYIGDSINVWNDRQNYGPESLAVNVAPSAEMKVEQNDQNSNLWAIE